MTVPALCCFPGDPERTRRGFAEVPLQSARGGESLSRPGGNRAGNLGWLGPKEDGMSWKDLAVLAVRSLLPGIS